VCACVGVCICVGVCVGGARAGGRVSITSIGSRHAQQHEGSGSQGGVHTTRAVAHAQLLANTLTLF
jgi:hypothetical protein